MRRHYLALLICCIWLPAGGLAFFAASVLSGDQAIAVAAGALTLSGVGSFMLGCWAEGRSSARLRKLSEAISVPSQGEAVTMETILGTLAQRLERTSHFKAAFTELDQPALIASASGEILAATKGLRALEPAVDGCTIDVLFGEGFTQGGGPAEETLVVVRGKRFEAHRRSAGTNGVLIELRPSGHFVADDDLEAFSSAISNGQTSFRFAPEAVGASPVLRAFTAVVEDLDLAAKTVRQLAAGEPADDEVRGRDSSVVRDLEQLAATVAALTEKLAEATSTRQMLEIKLVAIGDTADDYRAAAACFAELADGNRDAADDVAVALSSGRERANAAAAILARSRLIAADGAAAAERALTAIASLGTTTGDIDRMVAAIEDVGFRTNLLALSAAVEAGSAGDSGAGHAAVADQVRLLAEITTNAVKDIRAVVERSRDEAEAGSAEAEKLREILTSLDTQLQSLGQEAAGAVASLDRSSGALESLTRGADQIGKEAERLLLLPSRRRTAQQVSEAPDPRRAVGMPGR